MKKFLIFNMLLLFSVCISCDKNEEETVSCDDIADCRINVGELFLNAYSGAPSGVTMNGEAQQGWANFKITWTWDESVFGGTYELSGVPVGAEMVWGANNSTGDWYINDPSGETIMFAGIERTVLFLTPQKTMAFAITEDENSDLNGEWVFMW